MDRNQLIIAGILLIAVVAVLSLAYVAVNPRIVYVTNTANIVETSFVTETPTAFIQSSSTHFTTFEQSSVATQTSCSFPGPSYAWPPCGSVPIYGEGTIQAGWGNTEGFVFLYYDGDKVGVIDWRSPQTSNLSVLTGVCFNGFVEPFNKTFVTQQTGYAGGYTTTLTTWSNTYTFPLIWLTGVGSGDCYPP